MPELHTAPSLSCLCRIFSPLSQLHANTNRLALFAIWKDCHGRIAYLFCGLKLPTFSWTDLWPVSYNHKRIGWWSFCIYHSFEMFLTRVACFSINIIPINCYWFSRYVTYLLFILRNNIPHVNLVKQTIPLYKLVEGVPQHSIIGGIVMDSVINIIITNLTLVAISVERNAWHEKDFCYIFSSKKWNLYIPSQLHFLGQV